MRLIRLIGLKVTVFNATQVHRTSQAWRGRSLRFDHAHLVRVLGSEDDFHAKNHLIAPNMTSFIPRRGRGPWVVHARSSEWGDIFHALTLAITTSSHHTPFCSLFLFLLT